MLKSFFIPELFNFYTQHDLDPSEFWIMQDGARCHTTRNAQVNVIDYIGLQFGQQRKTGRTLGSSLDPTSCDFLQNPGVQERKNVYFSPPQHRQTIMNDNQPSTASRRASEIWKHFRRNLETGKAECLSCEAELALCGTTSNLWNHAKRVHKITEEMQAPTCLPNKRRRKKIVFEGDLTQSLLHLKALLQTVQPSSPGL